jgi:tetratricopeptide (TPR) repeat protein
MTLRIIFISLIDPNLAGAYGNRGIAYYKKNELDKAMADHNQAIRIDPNSALVYINRGAVYDEKRDFEKAIADYNQAIRLTPNDEEVKKILGMARQMRQLMQNR